LELTSHHVVGRSPSLHLSSALELDSPGSL
jgi:hypothetical protein